MCGILGISSQKEIEEEILIRCRDTLTHRGPDDSGVYFSPDRRIGLAHRRLSIIDLSSSGRQPMSNEDETVWLTYNGEIYNFQEIRKELETKGHIFKSHTDSEVIIHSYEEWGEFCVCRFRGMFAFGIWDEKKKKLLLVRDRLGIKPLFYYWDNKQFIFASEIKAILSYPQIDKEIDSSALWDYFTYLYIPTPKTAYKRISKLPPASILTFRDSKIKIEEYWDVIFDPDNDIDEKRAIEMLREKLDEAVRLRLVADVPLGVFLSGGMDSSTVIASMAKFTEEPVKAFSIGFDVEEHSEVEYARIVATHFKTEYYEKKVVRNQVEEMIPKVIQLYDEPYADGSAIPTYFISKTAREEVKVALSGDGGDEIFAGYNWYDRWMSLRKFDFCPYYLRSLASNIFLKLLPPDVRGYHLLYQLGKKPLEQYGLIMSILTPIEKQKLFSNDMAYEFRSYDDFWHFRKFWREELDPISRLQYLDLKTYLPDDILTKVDRASMAVSLEVRVPLLDHELVETVAGFPSHLRYNNGEKKYILKKAMDRILPSEILARGKKGFSSPLDQWLCSNARFIKNEFLKGEGISRGLLNREFIEHERSLSGAKLWTIMILDQWLSRTA